MHSAAIVVQGSYMDNRKPGSWDHGQFPTTHWSLIGRAGGDDGSRSRQALGQLLTRYRPAMRVHLIHFKQIGEHRADDLLQEFISTKFLEQNLAADADPARGRFRSLLLTSLDRFLISQQRRDAAKKRSADAATKMESKAIEAAVSSSQRSANDPFDIEWARQTLSEAVRRMKVACNAEGKQDVLAVFEARVLDPIFKGTAPIDYASLVDRFDFKSPSQAANILITGKRMFQRVLRSVVAEYATSAEQVDEEIRDLHQILSGSGAGSH